MRCPFCRADHDRVTNSRAGENGASIRRRRECLSCRRRFTTYERVEENPLKVVKKNGGRVPYDQHKLKVGIERACWNLAVSPEQVDKMVAEIEAEAFDRYDREVPSSVLGEMVMERLRRVNQVAYVRFASVYREFKDAGQFMELLREFVKEHSGVAPLLEQVPAKKAFAKVKGERVENAGSMDADADKP
jgi:transcriptional repressor NrdR